MPARYPETKIRIGVSSCLLGEPVRWDGGHKRDRTVKNQLGRIFEWVPTCPEVEIGMGIPREAVRLAGDLKSPRMVGNQTGKDWTPRMNRYSRQRSAELAKMGVCGYIFKSRSPSCGIAGIKVTGKNGKITSRGRGLFAGVFMNRCSLVPVEDESRLQDARVRDNFITRVFAYHRLTKLLSGRFSRKELLEFHAAHKYLLLAHSPKHKNALDRLLARANQFPPAGLKRRYAEQFMQALSYKTTVRKNADVLNHMLGMFKKQLTEAARQEVAETIEDYRNGLVPLLEPLTLIRHLVRIHRINTLKDQVYLHSHPKELMLRQNI